jgi:hypothetical protein
MLSFILKIIEIMFNKLNLVYQSKNLRINKIWYHYPLKILLFMIVFFLIYIIIKNDIFKIFNLCYGYDEETPAERKIRASNPVFLIKALMHFSFILYIHLVFHNPRILEEECANIEKVSDIKFDILNLDLEHYDFYHHRTFGHPNTFGQDLFHAQLYKTREVLKKYTEQEKVSTINPESYTKEKIQIIWGDSPKETNYDHYKEAFDFHSVHEDTLKKILEYFTKKLINFNVEYRVEYEFIFDYNIFDTLLILQILVLCGIYKFRKNREYMPYIPFYEVFGLIILLVIFLIIKYYIMFYIFFHMFHEYLYLYIFCFQISIDVALFYEVYTDYESFEGYL